MRKRLVQECFKDLDTFIEAYWAVCRGVDQARLLTGQNIISPACAGDNEEIPYYIWEKNWEIDRALRFELPGSIVYNTGEAPKWLAGEKGSFVEQEL